MKYDQYILKNNVFAEIYAPISSLATTIQVKAGQGARFGNAFPQLLTLENFDDNGKVLKREIVKLTGVSGDVLTVVRGFAPCPPSDDANGQGQSTFSFSADDKISLYIPKEIFDNIKNSFNDIYDNGVNKLRTEIVSGLQVEVNPGSVLVGSSYYEFVGGTITLTDNSTNYIEIDEDGNLVSNTTGRNLENTKISKVVTSSGEISSIEDRRLGTVGGKLGGLDIHDLTEKTTLNPNDEFVVADSENIFQNKKVLVKSMNFGTYMEVELGENVEAGSGKGASYIGSDGKAYLSNEFESGKNRVDGIIVDSGNTGETVRMQTVGNIRTGSNGRIGLVSNLQHSNSSGNMSSGYRLLADFGSPVPLSYIYLGHHSSLSQLFVRKVIVDGVGIKYIPCSTGGLTIIDLYGITGTTVAVQLTTYGSNGIPANQNNSGSLSWSVYYFGSTTSGNYGLVSNIHSLQIGYSNNGNFNLKPKSIETTKSLYGEAITSTTEISNFQAKQDGIIFAHYIIYGGNQNDIVDFYGSTNGTSREGLLTSSATGSYQNSKRSLPIEKGMFYKIGISRGSGTICTRIDFIKYGL